MVSVHVSILSFIQFTQPWIHSQPAPKSHKTPPKRKEKKRPLHSFIPLYYFSHTHSYHSLPTCTKNSITFHSFIPLYLSSITFLSTYSFMPFHFIIWSFIRVEITILISFIVPENKEKKKKTMGDQSTSSSKYMPTHHETPILRCRPELHERRCLEYQKLMQTDLAKS